MLIRDIDGFQTSEETTTQTHGTIINLSESELKDAKPLPEMFSFFVKVRIDA
jgi:hypothetical protein